MYDSMLRPKGEHLCFRVDNPPAELDFEAELKTLQTSVKKLQTENQGKKMCLLHLSNLLPHI